MTKIGGRDQTPQTREGFGVRPPEMAKVDFTLSYPIFGSLMPGQVIRHIRDRDTRERSPIDRGSLTFDGTFVPATHQIGAVGRGLPLVLNESELTRPLLALMVVGVAETALHMAGEWAKQRQAFGQPIARNQRVSFALAEHETISRPSVAARTRRLRCAWPAAPHASRRRCASGSVRRWRSRPSMRP